MPVPSRLKTFFSSTLLAYLLAFAVLWVIVDRKAAVSERLNAVLEWGDYPARLESGREPYDERRLRFAIRYYKLASFMLPQSDQPLATIGYCYARLGEEATAVRYYQRALARSPEHFWLEYDLGVLYYRMKDRPRAYAGFKRIAGRERDLLVKSAVLSSLSRVPEDGRRLLFAQAANFAMELQNKSAMMMAIIDAERSGGRSIDPGVGVVLHPWAFSFQPGKEIYY